MRPRPQLRIVRAPRGLTLLCLVFTVGCQSPPVAVERTREEAPLPAATESARDADEPPAANVAYEGAPVGVAPVEVLHEAGGMRVERQRWLFDGEPGLAWRVRLPLDADVSVGPADDVVAFQELLPTDTGPWAAINGGFYEVVPDSDGYRPMGLVVAGGAKRSALTRRGGSGVFVVDVGGPAVVHRRDFAGSPQAALQSIDRVVAGGESVVKRRAEAKRAARSAVVVGSEHLWLVIAVAERDFTAGPGGGRLSKSGSGLPLWAFAEYLLGTTDARDALNLDGGVSTQLAVGTPDFQLHVAGVRGTINVLVARPGAR